MAEPQSLWQMLGGPGSGSGVNFSFRNAMGEEDPRLGFGDALAQRQNSLIGMGGALLSGGGWGGAMQGYGQGAQADARTAYNLAQMRQQAADRAATERRHKEEFGFRQSEARRQADQWQQTFNKPPEAIRQLHALGITDPTEQRNLIFPKEGPDWGPVGKDADGNEVYGWRDKRTQTVTPFQMQGSATPRPPLTYGDQTFTPPPGLSPAGRKKWETDVAGAIADAQTGKQTQDQGTAAFHTEKMELALKQLGPTGDLAGLSRQGALLEGHPRVLFSEAAGRGFQSDEYQNYRNARDAFVNASLRRQSGATIRDDEFQRQEKILFPQPGEGPQQVEAKRALREAEYRQLRNAAGMGYRSPLSSGGGGATAGSGGGAVPPPPPGFQIVR